MSFINRYSINVYRNRNANHMQRGEKFDSSRGAYNAGPFLSTSDSVHSIRSITLKRFDAC